MSAPKYDPAQPIPDWQDFIFAFGQVLGGMHRPEVVEWFAERGIAQVDVASFVDLGKTLSAAFYREPPI